MDIKNLAERFKASGYLRVSAIALGVIVIAAAGAAYYFFVYEPEAQAVAAKPPPGVARKAAASQSAAKPALPQSTAESSVPATASSVPSAAPAKQPSGMGGTAKLVKPAVEQELEINKQKAAARSGQMAAPERADKSQQAPEVRGKLEVQDTAQVAPRAQEMPPEAPAGAASGEAASAAPAEPAPAPNVITPKYNDIVTAVLRGDREAVKELLGLGWWVDKPSDSGVTPLMAAVMNRDSQMVQLLLENGAEPSVQALNLARKNRDAVTTSLLEQKGAR